MGRRPDRRGVVEASLFGAYQRLMDLEDRHDIEPSRLSQYRAETQVRVRVLEEECEALGGDPASIRLGVQQRELERREFVAK